MKKWLVLFLLLFLVSDQVLAEEAFLVSDICSYKWEFEECIWANKNGQARTVEDFVCISSNNYFQIMGQIILDLEFKKIDKEVDTYFKNLEDNKSYYFWKDSKEPFTSAIDLIESKFDMYWEFGEKYMQICTTGENSIVQKTMNCFWGSIPANEASAYFFQDTTCRNLVATKLEINKQVAYDILKLNKHQIKQDEDKLYMQTERWRYDKLLEIIMVNVGYLERIWKKWPSKTKSAKWS